MIIFHFDINQARALVSCPGRGGGGALSYIVVHMFENGFQKYDLTRGWHLKSTAGRTTVSQVIRWPHGEKIMRVL